MAAPRLLLLPFLALFSVALTGLYVADVVSIKRLESACEMTWSWPVYAPVTWRAVPAHPKYALYRVDMKLARASLTGVPVLFVPGHLGSYKQARSLSRHLWDADETLFDLFALDLGEEPTGLSGSFVTDQATYLNDVVRAIMREYKRQNKKTDRQLVVPDSVVIVAHSMGGVVARTAQLLPNYKKRSVQHVVALGVPYDNPPFPFDAEMKALYDRMHSKKGEGEDTVYVAVTGGHKDTLVQTPLTSVDAVADSAHAFVALASAVPTVQTPVDHFCLLWCHQLLKVVAETLYKAVDLETRELVSNPDVRLAIAKEVLLGGGEGGSDAAETAALNVALHRSYVQDGYYPGEYAGYALLLPQFLTNLLRTKFMTGVVIMFVLALQIFYAQVAQWQARFNLQSTSSPQDLSQENFPSFTSMLHPAAHAPAFVENAVVLVANARSNLGLSKINTVVIAVLTLAAAGYFGYGKLASDGQSLIAPATMAAEVVILYAYALGLLYALTKLFSLLQRFAVSPIVTVLNNVTDGLNLRRWMVIAIIHVVVQVLGQIRSPSLVDPSRVLGLLVVASFVVFMLYLLALGGSNDGTLDQQRMQHSLFAVLWLSIFPWVGKVAYFAATVRFPPPELSNDLLMEGGSYIAVLSMFTYLISLSLDCMVPLPPTAFFGASSGQDAASAYGKSSSLSGSSVKITAENCPKCIFEDGGPGAVLVEYNDRTTRRVVAGKNGEVVYVGPTFRVVSCDCVYRFQNSRDFCDFCIRSCRLCGGGNGNFQEAAKYKDFLEESKVDLAMHALVPMTFQICAAVQATYGLYRAHLSFYLTPVCVLALIIYQILLRHPIEARRIKSKQRKNTTKKKKASKSKSKSSTTTTTTASSTSTSTTTTSETTTRNKKKKKRKSGTSTTSSAASPLIEEVSASS
ncbi:GPI inositol-deacylase [Phytophthora pseudosyringae]|uniref:GPI inositol-deacylase n=1 Tax=Phytophthora pseudosyringae TaxID=221518 RepID=A0A8T1VSY2_9STRA|nr:GPI inositol-deacylase [Phytophthora pseudosyringae]